jgi:hypothetical protein
VTAALVAAAVLAALPLGTARYRAELAGAPVGVVELRVACEEARCAVRYASRMRLPVEAGGAVERLEVEVAVDREGRFVPGGPLRVDRNGTRLRTAGIAGAVPASLVEAVLAATGEGCVPFFDEERPALRTACATRRDGGVAAKVGDVPVRITPGEDGFPRAVEVAERFRFVRDAAAVVPSRPPRLAGTRVPGPADPRAARSFCGVAANAPSPVPSASLPALRATGESCREITRAWLAAAAAQGIEGREAVGVAWDGRGFAWHEWAEVKLDGGWLAVDPTFGELPARSTRFTVARFEGHDPGGRELAGTRILSCWGAAAVE